MTLIYILGAVVITFLVVLFFNVTSFRMVYLIKNKRYDEAIAIAERVPLEKRGIQTIINQIGAYYHGGQKQMARDLFMEVKQKGQIPPSASAAMQEWEEALFKA